MVGVIDLCKANFMSYIFYNNTIKLYTQKHHKYIIMLKKYFSIASTNVSKKSKISRFILNALADEAYLELCRVFY